MDPAAVAAYYRGKGYVVRDNARVAGPSGGEHKVPLLAEGPLGSLAVFFGDFGGVDGPEMGGARKVAREIGATPVLCAAEFGNQDRQLAAKLGVVLVDDATLAGEGQPTPPGLGVDTGRAWPGLAPMPARRGKAPEEEPHPWPASGRVGGRDGPTARAVDVDEILAQPRDSPSPDAGPVEPTLQADVAEPGRGGEGMGDSGGDGARAEGLWKKPRTRGGSAAKPPRASGSRPFAWLGSDVSPHAPPPQGTAALAVEYDDVVPAKADGGPEERLGDSIELQPTMDELRRKATRDRLMRRLFWILFAAVLVYLVALWWL